MPWIRQCIATQWMFAPLPSATSTIVSFVTQLHYAVATLDADKCFDSICHVSLFLKRIDVLPTYQWLLLYNWYRKLNAVVKWNGCYSKMFDITRGTRQGSKLSPNLFNIFINQLLLDLNDCDVGVRIGDVLYNSMAYADDITVFSTNAKDLQRLIDMCTM